VDLDAGTQVTPVVRLVRPLGRGGMGAVWMAEHQTLRTEVVVKFMADALASDPVSLARFSHEASAAAAVKSPHVVQMLDHGFTDDGTPFIVMELLDGEDLRRRLVREHVVPLAELSAIIVQACKALGRAHSTGIIHRDIKPDNIFLCRTDDGEPFVKLLDFGIAKSGGPTEFHMTQTGVMVGTPFYMSPEQAVGAPAVDATTDLWSLGVVAFEAMTGTRPFDGPTIGALTIAICNERPPVPSEVNPQLPTEVDAWLARACARERTQRFPTAKAMGEALTAAVRSAAPRSVPLAFDETSLSHGGENLGRPPAPLVLTPSYGPAPETASGLATTTTPLSRTHGRPLVGPAALASVQNTAAPAATSGRAMYVAAGALIIAVGVAAGFLFAQRGDEPASPPPVAASTGPVAEAPPRATTPWQPSPVAESSAAPRPSASSAALTAPAVVATTRAAPAGHAASSPGSHAAVPPVVKPAGSAAVSSGHGPSGCEPPFYFDSAGDKVFKKECL
jgi:serine/threonine protein kinase